MRQSRRTATLSFSASAPRRRLLAPAGRLAATGLAAIALTLGAVSLAGAAAADIAHGEAIAKRWCASCHVTSNDQTAANVDAPSFASIARAKRQESLSTFLTDPHPKMPDMSLSRDEIADLAAYISSLRR